MRGDEAAEIALDREGVLDEDIATGLLNSRRDNSLEPDRGHRQFCTYFYNSTFAKVLIDEDAIYASRDGEPLGLPYNL